MKKKLLASIIFLIICIISTFIYAADTAKFEISANATTIKPGDEVTFTVKITDFESQEGVYGVEGIISYSSDIFEEVSKSNISSPNGWSVYFYNNKIILEGDSSANNNSNVIDIKLKAKNDASLVGKTGEITLNNAVIYNAEKTWDIPTVSASVKIGEESSSNQDPTPTPTPTATPDGGSESTPTPSTKPNNTPSPTATAKPNSGENKNDVPVTNIDTNTSSGSGSTNKGNTSSGSSSSSTIKGSTTSSSSLPKAGIGSAITVLTIAAAALGTVAHIKLRKYREI